MLLNVVSFQVNMETVVNNEAVTMISNCVIVTCLDFLAPDYLKIHF